jgi:hypothetical protein
VGAELFHVNGWTDEQTGMAKLIVASCSFRTRLKTNSTDDPVHATKTYGDAGVQQHVFLVSVLHGSVESASRHIRIIRRKKPWYLLDRMLEGPQSCSVFCEQEKNLCPWPKSSLIPLYFNP